MSQSSRQVWQSRSIREQRTTERSITGNILSDKGRNNNGGYQQLVYNSYQYPAEIGFQDLVSKKNVLYELLRQFEQNKGDRVIFDPHKTEDYFKRLLLLENQIDSLMRTKLVYEKGVEGDSQGHRTIDYGNFINQKQNQINQLERKILHYETNFRKHDHRTRELEDQISRLHSIILQKNRMIESFNGMPSKEWPVGKQAFAFTDRLIGELQKIKKTQGLSMGLIEGTVESWILKLPQNSNLRQKIKIAQTRMFNERKYRDFVFNKLGQVNSLYKSQINDLSTRLGSNSRISYDDKILSALRVDDNRNDPLFESVFGAFIGGGDYEIHSRGDYLSSKTVEVPVQDSRTKALIHKLASQMKRIYIKYPSLKKQIDPKLAQFFSQEIIDLIEVDSLDRLVEIVKIQPQIVKVDNVYAYSSQKNRKVQFHLRVLIKALLQEMDKIKMKTGISPEIDEGVIGMVRQQVLDIVNVDDILRVYRTVPKIVEVEKVIEKIVQKIIEVPTFVTAETRVEVPVQVKRYDVVQNIVHVPIQYPVATSLIQQKLVNVPQIINTVIPTPQIHQHIIQTIVQRPKVVQVDNVVTLERQIAKVVQVPGPQKIVEIPRPQIIQCVRQVIVETRQETQTIKIVQKIIEKVVEVIREVPKIVQVEKIITKIIPVKQYIESQRIINHVSQRYQPVQLIVEKIVPICRVQERIVQVPQIIEKIVPVIQYRTECIEVQRIVEKPIFQTQLKIVQKIKQVPVVQIREVQRIIEKIIEVPVIHQKIIIQKQYIKEPYVETIEKVIHKGVQLQKPVIMYEDRIVEIDRIINHCIQVPQIINIVRETLVPYQKVVNNVISEPTIIQKIIQKIVEVPKVVQVERIVQKIVIVPRIVQKIIEVQKIVEKIVKQVIFQQKIIERQYRVEVPVFHERLIEVEKPINVYQRVEVPKQVREQIMVKDTITHTIPQIHELTQPPRIVVETREVDVPMIIQKICTLRTTDNKYVELRQVQIVPVQIQLPIDIIRQKIVPIEHVRTEIQIQNAIIEKVVRVEVEAEPRVIQVDRIQQKLRVQKQFQVVENRIPYYNDKIIEVECIVEKLIQPIYYEVEKIVTVPTFVDKIVQRIINIPKIYEIERRNDVIVKDPIIIPIEKIVPQLITLNRSIQNIVDRIVEVPRLLEKLNIVNQTIQKIVPQHCVQTRVQQVRIIEERQVICERIRQVQNKIHLVSEVLQIVEKIIEKPSQPVIIFEDRVMEVPFIVEKIVQKIVVMPQVVEVLKYVHQLMETDNLTAMMETSVQDAQYTKLARNVNLQVTKLKSLLTEIKTDNHQVNKQVSIIENFLGQFYKFIAYPRVREIINERKVDNIIQKQRIVKIPVNSSQNAQRSLASAVLIDKLINQLRRFKKANSSMDWELDEDILSIFGTQLEPVSRHYGNDYNKVLDQYVRAVHNRFSSAGNWTSDQQIMLKSFIQERFDLAYNYKRASADLTKTKARYESVLQSYGKQKQYNERMRKSFDIFGTVFPSIIQEGRKQNRIDQRTQNQFNQAYENLTQLMVGYALGGAKTQKLKPLEDERFHSLMREKQEQIIRLKDKIRDLMRGKTSERVGVTTINRLNIGGDFDQFSGIKKERDEQIFRLKQQVTNLTAQLNTLRATIKNMKAGDSEQYLVIIRQKQELIMDLKRQVKTMQQQKYRIGSSSPLSRSSAVSDTQNHQTIRTLQSRIHELETQIKRLRIIESEHRGCQSIIDSLRTQINKVRLEISQVRSPKQSRGTKHSTTSPQDLGHSDRHKDSSEGSFYGVNYLQYANLDQNADVSENLGRVDRADRGVYRSGNYDTSRRDLGGHNIEHISSQYMTASNQSNGGGYSNHDLGTTSRRNQTTYQSGYKVEYSSSGGGNSYQNIDYSRGTIPSRQNLEATEARYEGSEQGGDSRVYGSTRKTIESRESGTRRYERSGNERKE